MKRPKMYPVETNCAACEGTGIKTVKQPGSGRRIYPPKCEVCDGKGKMKEATN